tara:strand:+ start:1038 stop:1598 length:561 start_codon:yes stop_codon:yes gene_type:complete
MNEHATNIFNTPIWGYVLTSEKYQAEDYLEKVIELSSTEPSANKSNAGGGWQSRDNLQEDPLFKEFVNNTLIKSIGQPILKEYGIVNPVVQSMWASVNNKHSFNYQHTHEGYLSGVFYLQVPKDSGRLIFTNPAVRSESHPIRQKNYPIIPQELACIVFPSWLEHYVEPNMSDEARVSISFNIGIS